MTVAKDVGMNVKMNTVSFAGLKLLHQGEKIEETPIYDLCDYVDGRHDCADFRLIVLVKTFIAYADLLSEATVSRIRQTMLAFKYWMDEPGEDGMCYWSENHQLLFATCEYFAGFLFAADVFANNGETGQVHYEKAKERIARWLKHRATYGFIEWHSNTYYEEDIAPLCVLIDYAIDEDLAKQATMILDILMLDFAHHSFQGRFVATSGRCYEKQKKDSANADVNDLLNHAFHFEAFEPDYTRLSALFLTCQNYHVPAVIQAIAKNRLPMLIKESSGLDLSEVAKEFPRRDFAEYGMFLWAMEAFTNVESIETTIDLFNAWKMHSNTFLKDLKMINIPILRKLRLLPTLVKILNPATQGVAIERADVQTYKTADYMLSSAQRHRPGKFGDQQHIWQATLPQRINIFSTHPAAPMFDDSARNFSPSYWVGNGIQPDVAQDQNKLFLIYDTTPRKGFLERGRQHFVHYYVPVERFAEIKHETNAFYGRINDTYLAILTSHPIQVNGDEFIITAKKSAHVVILSSKRESDSFEAFQQAHRADQLAFQGKRLDYQEQSYILHYKGRFLKDQNEVSTRYPRLDSPFVNVKRKALLYEIEAEGMRLNLDFQTNERTTKGDSHVDNRV
jgi:hypothetical protein